MTKTTTEENQPNIDSAFLSLLQLHRAGAVDLPPKIMAAMKVFQGGTTWAVEARLKTRIQERRLALFFETISLHVIVRDSIMDVVKQVAEKTKIMPLLGSPS